MEIAKSIRSQILDLKPRGCLRFRGAKENTIRNTACIIGGLAGRKYKVTKKNDVISVYRYE